MTASARPTGVTILAILALIGGVFGLIGGLGLIAGGALLGGIVGGGAGVALGGLAFVFGIVTLGLAIAELFFAYGAWGLKPWGWSLGVILALASIVWAVVTALASGDFVNSLIGGAIGIIISAVILYYLMTPAVKTAFGRA
jgi:hypothetical protein